MQYMYLLKLYYHKNSVVEAYTIHTRYMLGTSSSTLKEDIKFTLSLLDINMAIRENEPPIIDEYKMSRKPITRGGQR